MVITRCQDTDKILVATYDAHFVVLKVDEDLTKLTILRDIYQFNDCNEYRYVRHASIRGDSVIFCSEQGK
jgi:hypothetical protein